jgi:hypothetical protein
LPAAIAGKYRIADERVVVMPGTRDAPSAGDGPGPAPDESSSRATTAERDVEKLAAEYVKKIFQVPFGLPRVSTDDLERFFKGVLRTSGAPTEQTDHLRDQVQPHLEYLSGGGAVNPREVKRLINAYTLQMKLLSARRLKNLNPQAVLTILTMSFRTDWGTFYELLVTDPAGLADAIRSVRESGDEVVKLWPGDQPVPRELREYLDGAGKALLDAEDLEQYVASVESGRTVSRELAEVQSLVVDLGRRSASIAESGEAESHRAALSSGLEALDTQVGALPTVPAATRIQTTSSRLFEQMSTLPQDGDADTLKAWGARTEAILRAMYYDLRQLRGRLDVGAQA